MIFPLVSTRFNANTWNENELYRAKYEFSGCIYGAPQPLSAKINIDSLVFVVEMNNSLNKIMGIGLIRNMHVTEKYYKVYGTGNYNRFIYVGKYRMTREELSLDLVQEIEKILFKGKTHSKRGSGLTSVPHKLLRGEIDIQQEIKTEFTRHFAKKPKELSA